MKPAVLALVLFLVLHSSTVLAFEGRIHAVMIQGNQTNALLYTAGTNSLRVEMTVTNWPNPVDIVDRNTGALTLVFPSNRSFVQLKPATDGAAASPSGPSGMPVPPGVGPQSTPGSPSMPGMPNLPSGSTMPVMPAMPMRPMMPDAKLELQATEQKTNLLGFVCQQYLLKSRGETLEIWATDQLLPYQPYVQNQPHLFGPRRIEEQWSEMLTSRKLFPLLATLRYDQVAERFRFEVQSVTPQKLTDEDGKLFQPPSGYFEIRPLPF